MRWRYQIVRYYLKDGTPYYGIGEVYYVSEGAQPHACTMEPVKPYGEVDPADVIEELKLMLADATRYPVWDSNGPYAPEPQAGPTCDGTESDPEQGR